MRRQLEFSLYSDFAFIPCISPFHSVFVLISFKQSIKLTSLCFFLLCIFPLKCFFSPGSFILHILWRFFSLTIPTGLFHGRRREIKLKNIQYDCILSKPIQWFWVSLFNLLGSVSISSAGTGLNTTGTCLSALPACPVFHEHQHQQQEGQVWHSDLLTKYGTEKCLCWSTGWQEVDKVRCLYDETIDAMKWRWLGWSRLALIHSKVHGAGAVRACPFPFC